MAQRKRVVGMLVLLALGLAIVSLAGCVTVNAEYYNTKIKADHTYKDVVEGNSAAIVFSGTFNHNENANKEKVAGTGGAVAMATETIDVVIESFDGQTLNWRSKPSAGIGHPLSKAVVPSGVHSYVITTSVGGRLEGEMEFVSGGVYDIYIDSRGTKIEIKAIP